MLSRPERREERPLSDESEPPRMCSHVEEENGDVLLLLILFDVDDDVLW